MQSNKDFCSPCEQNDVISAELGMFFDNVMSTVVDFFEEAILE